MDKNRTWLIGSIVVMVAVLLMGMVLGVQPQLAAVATADATRAEVQASNEGQASVLAQLKTDFAGIATLKAELVDLRASVPGGTQIPGFVTQLDALAGSTSVTLTGMTVTDAVPYAPPAAPTGSAGADTGTSAEASAATSPLTDAQITPTTFASLAVTIVVTGSYAHALDFVSGLQSGRRLYLVTGITTSPVDGTGTAGTTSTVATGQVVATITGLIYVLVPPATAATATPPSDLAPEAPSTATPAAK